MKDIFKLAIFVFLLFSIALPIKAQGNVATSTPSKQTRQEVTQNADEAQGTAVREANSERIENKAATQAARLTEMKKNNVRKHYTRMGYRLQAAINRLETLITRIQSRITKIEEADEDIDTTEISNELEEAKLSLANIENMMIAEAKDKMEEMANSEEPQESFQDLKETILEIKQEIIDVHQTLVKLIGDIKGLRVTEGL